MGCWSGGDVEEQLDVPVEGDGCGPRLPRPPVPDARVLVALDAAPVGEKSDVDGVEVGLLQQVLELQHVLATRGRGCYKVSAALALEVGGELLGKEREVGLAGVPNR